MYPVLVNLFGLHFYSFGLMIALAFAACVGWVCLRAKQQKESAETLYEITFYLLIAGLVGAKLTYFIFFPKVFFADPLAALISNGGLVWYGGMIAVTAGAWFLAKKKDITFSKLTDILTPPCALGLAIGRIGCLLAGCCYGAATKLPWGIVYPKGHETYPQHVHPSPIYETTLLGFVIWGLLWVEKQNPKPGTLIWVFFILYGIVRFILEYFRGDRLVWLEAVNLSASQVISLVGIAIGVYMLLTLKYPRYGGFKKTVRLPKQR